MVIDRDKLFDCLVVVCLINIFASTVYAKSSEPLLEVDMLVMVSLAVIGGLIGLLWLVCCRKTRRVVTRFSGVLKIELVSANGVSSKHIYPLYRETAGALSLANVVNVCKIELFKDIGEHIWFKAKDKRVIEFYYNADCTVLEADEILLKHKQHFIYVGSSVVVLLKDNIHKLVLTYEVIE